MVACSVGAGEGEGVKVGDAVINMVGMGEKVGVVVLKMVGIGEK